MFKKLMAMTLLLTIGLFQGVAIAGHLGTPIQGPGDSPMCPPGYAWDKYTAECFKE